MVQWEIYMRLTVDIACCGYKGWSLTVCSLQDRESQGRLESSSEVVSRGIWEEWGGIGSKGEVGWLPVCVPETKGLAYNNWVSKHRRQ